MAELFPSLLHTSKALVYRTSFVREHKAVTFIGGIPLSQAPVERFANDVPLPGSRTVERFANDSECSFTTLLTAFKSKLSSRKVEDIREVHQGASFSLENKQCYTKATPRSTFKVFSAEMTVIYTIGVPVLRKLEKVLCDNASKSFFEAQLWENRGYTIV